MNQVASCPTVLKSCNFTNPHVFVTRLVAAQNESRLHVRIDVIGYFWQLYITQILQYHASCDAVDDRSNLSPQPVHTASSVG
jgi:hypothetical protein